MSILMAVIVFSLLIFIHEFGHFILAKKNGVKVIEFSIGFGPRLFSFTKGETLYSFKLVPFGGACQMLNKELLSEEDRTSEDLSRAFESKSVWARMSIVLAGPIFNFVLAFVLAVVVIGVVGYDKPEVTQIESGSPADIAGLKKGDVITSFNGANIDISRQIYLEQFANPISEDVVVITYMREGEEYRAEIKPEYVERYVLGFTYSSQSEKVEIIEISEDGPLKEAGAKKGDIIKSINDNEFASSSDFVEYLSKNAFDNEELNIVLLRDDEEIKRDVTPVFSSGGYSLGFSYNQGRVETDAIGVLKYATVEVGYQISTVFKSIGMLFTGQVTVKDFSGPVGIVDYIDTAYQESKSDGVLYIFLKIANLTMLLSANLGVMNLLPIPGLDGGRLLFQVIEVIFRRPVKHEEYFHLAGMVLIMLFAVFVLFQDIFKLF